MKIYIGYDEREHEAAMVAAKSLHKVTNGELKAEFLVADKLAAQGLLTRLVDERGQGYDLASNAPVSTRFANSRFLTPLLCQEQFALFLDCDMVFCEDPRNMLRGEVLPEHAVSVVKHDHQPVERWKMMGLTQTSYPRKNWSSVMLFNCDHPANRRLSLRDVNERPGRDLHAFYWLHDDEIGALDPRWNWLVGVQPEPAAAGIAHFTLGGPWLPGWHGAPYDGWWCETAEACKDIEL